MAEYGRVSGVEGGVNKVAGSNRIADILLVLYARNSVRPKACSTCNGKVTYAKHTLGCLY